MYLVSLLENIQMVPYLPRIIKENADNNGLFFDNSQLEGIVYYCYRRKTTEQPVYIENRDYLLALIKILS